MLMPECPCGRELTYDPESVSWFCEDMRRETTELIQDHLRRVQDEPLPPELIPRGPERSWPPPRQVKSGGAVTPPEVKHELAVDWRKLNREQAENPKPITHDEEGNPLGRYSTGWPGGVSE